MEAAPTIKLLAYDDPRQLIRLTSAAEILDLSPSALRNEVAEGRLKVVRFSSTGNLKGGTLLIRRADLEAWFRDYLLLPARVAQRPDLPIQVRLRSRQ